jgi:hypothetical protein
MPNYGALVGDSQAVFVVQGGISYGHSDITGRKPRFIDGLDRGGETIRVFQQQSIEHKNPFLLRVIVAMIKNRTSQTGCENPNCYYANQDANPPYLPLLNIFKHGLCGACSAA